eukprot:1206363-Prymnesium_polylepis.4
MLDQRAGVERCFTLSSRSAAQVEDHRVDTTHLTHRPSARGAPRADAGRLAGRSDDHSAGTGAFEKASIVRQPATFGGRRGRPCAKPTLRTHLNRALCHKLDPRLAAVLRVRLVHEEEGALPLES